MYKMKDKQFNKEYHKQYYKDNKEAIKARRLETAKRMAATNTVAKEWKERNKNNPNIFNPFHGQIPPLIQADIHPSSYNILFDAKKLVLQSRCESCEQ
jgi:hypothetical protein